MSWGGSGGSSDGESIVKMLWHDDGCHVASLNEAGMLRIFAVRDERVELKSKLLYQVIRQMLWGWQPWTLIVVNSSWQVKVWNFLTDDLMLMEYLSNPDIAPELCQYRRLLATFPSSGLLMVSDCWEPMFIVHTDSPCCAFAWEPNTGKAFVARTKDSRLCITKTSTKATRTKYFQGDSTSGSYQDRVAFDLAGALIASRAHGRSVQVWDCKGFVCGVPGSKEFQWLYTLKISSDGELRHVLATVQSSNFVQLWTPCVKKKRLEFLQSLQGIDLGATAPPSLLCNKYDVYLAAVCNRVYVWKLSSSECVYESDPNATTAVWHHGHSELAVGRRDGGIFVVGKGELRKKRPRRDGSPEVEDPSKRRKT